MSDVTVIKRLDLTQGATLDNVATAPKEVVNLASDGESVFWTSAGDSAIRRTDATKTTTTIIHSNGTPTAMGVAGDRLYWAGVDISGLLGALQTITTAGQGAREVSRFSTGFHVMAGSATYLYYAIGSPASIHRIAVSTGTDEIVTSDAMDVTDFVVGADHAYWVERGSPEVGNGQLRRVAHDGKTAETLAVSIAYPVALAVSGHHVYVASRGTQAEAFEDGKILDVTLPR